MSSSSASSSGGIGFAGLLTIAFIVLKLTGVIAWSWLWVLSPLWISFAIALVLLAVFGLFMLVAALLDKGESKRNAKKRAALIAARRGTRYPIRTK